MHHTLTVSFLLTQTSSEHVQTNKCRRTRANPPPPPNTPALHCRLKLDPQFPKGRETKKTERSVDPVMCVLYTPQPPFPPFFPSDPTFLQFQAANSAACQLHSQSPECPWNCLPPHLYVRHTAVACKVTREHTASEASPSPKSHLLPAKLYIRTSCRITRRL